MMIYVKRLVFVLMSFLILSTAVRAQPPARENPGRFKERIITMRNWQLTEVFDLRGKRAEKVFSILKRFDREREDLIMQRRRILNEMRHEVKNPDTTAGRLKELIKGFNRTNIELAGIPGKEVYALKDIFTPRELARYLLFSERFSRELKASIYERLQKRGRRPPPGRREPW
ncbi:MAG TPA: hypothetical protein ENH07_06655 [Nitrospirae bacterium]|nr:hypothetical protein [Nitrospirota bacterium]